MLESWVYLLLLGGIVACKTWHGAVIRKSFIRGMPLDRSQVDRAKGKGKVKMKVKIERDEVVILKI